MGNHQQPRDDAELRARALARWEGEGGALAGPDQDPLDGVALRLLARLGAALLEHWDELPAALQEPLLLRARTLGGTADRLRARDALARLLQRYDGSA